MQSSTHIWVCKRNSLAYPYYPSPKWPIHKIFLFDISSPEEKECASEYLTSPVIWNRTKELIFLTFFRELNQMLHYWRLETVEEQQTGIAEGIKETWIWTTLQISMRSLITSHWKCAFHYFHTWPVGMPTHCLTNISPPPTLWTSSCMHSQGLHKQALADSKWMPKEYSSNLEAREILQTWVLELYLGKQKRDCQNSNWWVAWSREGTQA